MTARWTGAVTHTPQSREISATLAFASDSEEAPPKEVSEAAAVHVNRRPHPP